MSIFVAMEPKVTTGGDVVTIAISGNTSGLNYSGLSASLQTYGVTDIDYAQPNTLRNVTMDSSGQRIFKFASLPGGNFILAARYPNSPEVGGTEVECSTIGRLVLALDDLLCAFRHIPRFEELGRISEDGSYAQWGWGKWHIDPAPSIIRGVNAVGTSEYQIDYETGRVYFNRTLVAGEEVRADYQIRLLDLSIYKQFFAMALGYINAKKPQTNYDINNFPQIAEGAMLMYGYMQAARTIIPKLSTFAYRRLFEDPDGLASQLRANSAEMSAQFDGYLATIKRRGLIAPAAVSGFNVGRQGVWQVDGINFQQFLVAR